MKTISIIVMITLLTGCQQSIEVQETNLNQSDQENVYQNDTNELPPDNKERLSDLYSGDIDYLEANKIEAYLVDRVGYYSKENGYPVVETNQTTFYSDNKVISKPSSGQNFYGQDATYEGNKSSYIDNKDGTVSDQVTGLMWQQDPGEKLTWIEAVNKLESFDLAGYGDWRLPTIKELYSLVQFSGVTGLSSSKSIPYIDTYYFEFEYGDQVGEARFIDSQMASSTIYDSTTMKGNATVFGFNFADGRIKGYPITKEFYVYYVRGNTSYGQNQYVDNEDGTITDEATGLMWMELDSGHFEVGTNEDGTLDWSEALTWAENLEYAGYDDWKLPNAKELQSIVDYSNSPSTTNSAAIDDLFQSSKVYNYLGEEAYGYYWSSTTHLDGKNQESKAVYVCFGEGLGVMNNQDMDVHGAGSQRSDYKSGTRSDYPRVNTNAPQGDEQRVYNLVRLVREIN